MARNRPRQIRSSEASARMKHSEMIRRQALRGLIADWVIGVSDEEKVAIMAAESHLRLVKDLLRKYKPKEWPT